MDRFMEAAIEEARTGLAEGGIPIGSVLVRDGEIIGRGRNRRVQQDDPILHAEIDCLQRAGRVGSYKDTVLYSTLMPCHLCAGAVVLFKIPKVIVGESKTFAGAREFMESHGVEVVDLESDECVELLGGFIREHPEIWDEDIGES
jgi:cytosine deaminase